MISIAIPIVTRQFLVTDLVIENKIESNELYQRISLDVEKIKLSKSFHYSAEMFILFIEFMIVFGLVVGVFKAFAEKYKSSEILNAISEGYIILLLGYLIKILYFILLDDFSIDRYDNYQILSLADFYSFDDVEKFQYLRLSNYNLFRLFALLFITFSIFKITDNKIKLTLIVFSVLISVFFLIPLIGM